MSQQSVRMVLRLVVLSASFERQFSPLLTSAHGISLSEFLVLSHLSRAPLGRMRRVDLGALLSLGNSSVTRITAPLERDGLVARESDTRDARVVYTSLTTAGRSKALEAGSTLDRLSEGLFDDRWSVQEFADLLTLLGRIGRSVPADGLS
jgi:DNA-binding MarR family transcriptional regulator